MIKTEINPKTKLPVAKGSRAFGSNCDKLHKMHSRIIKQRESNKYGRGISLDINSESGWIDMPEISFRDRMFFFIKKIIRNLKGWLKIKKHERKRS